MLKRHPAILILFALLLCAALVAWACGSGKHHHDNPADDDAVGDDSGDDTADDDSVPSLYVDTTNPFGPGGLAVQTLNLPKGQQGAPADLTVYFPTQQGQYALVQFQHGFLMSKDYYSGILEQLAGHGYVVVAAQMYAPGGLPIGKPTSVEEAKLAGDVAAWAIANLSAVTGLDVRGDLFGIAGHSRGGKATWILLKGNHSFVKAVAGVDPVDSNMAIMGENPVCDGPFGFPFPSLVIGTGLGTVKVLGQACAPDGQNHVQFYGDSSSPAFHVITADYGHLDMLNDTTPGCGIECDICANGPERQGMRTLTAGLLTAFFRATLQGDGTALAFLTDKTMIPGNVTLEWK